MGKWRTDIARFAVCCLLMVNTLTMQAQQTEPSPQQATAERLGAKADTLKAATLTKADVERLDSLIKADSTALADQQESVVVSKEKHRQKRDWSTWKPNPQRALWLALVIPGAGQIYNRKYWKLPIIYGGFVGCIYALTWNNMMYKDYTQAYLDITDDDPGTASYNKFLHLGTEITEANAEKYENIFRNRKDKYRRWRDLSFFVMLGVYALSVIDAYVDAELSQFDISRDLSLKIEPAVIPNHSGGNPLQAQSLGLNCKLNF